MLEKKSILRLFSRLNDELARRQERGEIGIVGGAVMCLVYHARASTKDVDAIFRPPQVIREIALQLAKEEGLSPDWLNDGAKGYVQGEFVRDEVVVLSNLRVWAPEARYMLAMKCLSARFDSSDGDDIRFLLGHLKLNDPEEVFQIIEHYFPKNQIPPKTKFFLEEILSD